MGNQVYTTEEIDKKVEEINAIIETAIKDLGDRIDGVLKLLQDTNNAKAKQDLIEKKAVKPNAVKIHANRH